DSWMAAPHRSADSAMPTGDLGRAFSCQASVTAAGAAAMHRTPNFCRAATGPSGRFDRPRLASRHTWSPRSYRDSYRDRMRQFPTEEGTMRFARVAGQAGILAAAALALSGMAAGASSAAR